MHIALTPEQETLRAELREYFAGPGHPGAPGGAGSVHE